MQNETLRPESTPSGLENFSPLIDTGRIAHAPGTLVDKYGRRVTYVRLSITDRCDFRCTYCMAEEMTFLPHPGRTWNGDPQPVLTKEPAAGSEG